MTRTCSGTLFVPLLGLALPAVSQAEFLSDSKATLEARNFYFSRDFRSDTSTQSKREEWAQGFILRAQSGYTEGTVGFGLDAIGMLGIRLDSSPDRTGTGLLPKHGDGRAADEFSTLAPTAKMKISATELKIGALTPTLPLLAANYSRLVPQVFNGALLTSSDIDSLTLTAGRIEQVKARDSSNFEDMTITSMSGAFAGSAKSDGMGYLGLDYKPSPNLILSAHHSKLEDIYDKSYLGLQYSMPVGSGKAFAEIRYFDAGNDGRALAGNVDNRTLSTNFGYKIGAHTISGGYQKSRGESAYPYLAGSDTYLFSEMLVSAFGMESERALHARYDFDFVAYGLPGLSFTARYVRGDQIDPEQISGSKAAGLRRENDDGTEWERSTDITYVVQSGPLKDFSIRWRNSTYRSTYTDSADENRLILSYLIKF
ncbi:MULTISPECIES: OprD family porin [Pseudomonas]|uniref:OprD family porin n=1 Tax=Pseudomonas TaxID=286 RepID=UPI000D4F1F7A|nr:MULTISPECIES: OprD family porin [Pseudomonas]PTC01787.1 outer membrane porin, OprD family [Thalassospira xiamenensis]ELF6204308.1 OprD family porin [Pseudomonas putida]MCE0881716.1 OprD family porin [Pseudomonas putida]MCE0966979.1 OprD family porin [Pseudomonas sp. NMI4491_12]MDO1496923.1 OprD family porin [Pseudomonas putida]